MGSVEKDLAYFGFVFCGGEIDFGVEAFILLHQRIYFERFLSHAQLNLWHLSDNLNKLDSQYISYFYIRSKISDNSHDTFLLVHIS